MNWQTERKIAQLTHELEKLKKLVDDCQAGYYGRRTFRLGGVVTREPMTLGKIKEIAEGYAKGCGVANWSLSYPINVKLIESGDWVTSIEIRVED